MNLFSFFNGTAGQSVLLDALMRFLYVASVPLAATLWLALLFFRHESRAPFIHTDDTEPVRLFEYSSRRAVVAATFFALGMCAALWFAFQWFVQDVLQTPILSPRPFVTHWVNLLVAEPNDNSFPSPEAILLGILWIASWALSPRAFWGTFALALAGCVARVFCGTHYVADVVVGLGVGAAICALSMALFGVVLRLSPKPFRQRAWRLRVQGATGFATISALLFFGISTLHQTPRLLTAWQERHSMQQLAASAQQLRDIEYSKLVKSRANVRKVSTASRDATSLVNARDVDARKVDAPSSSEENTDAQGKTIPRVGVTTTGGFLPREEMRLLRALRQAKLAHSLVSVDVASLRDNVSHDADDKSFAMHFASVRFQVRGNNATERRRVAQTAQRIVQIAFAANSALQSVDVVGVVLNHPQRDKVRYAVFAVGTIPVWTASVQRKDLVSQKFAPHLNSPSADAGLWLRARSRLYINERVLPLNDVKLNGEAKLFIETATPSLPLQKGKGDKGAALKSNRSVDVTQRVAKIPSTKGPVAKTTSQKLLPRRAPEQITQKRNLQKSLSQKPKTATPTPVQNRSISRTSSTRSSAQSIEKAKLNALKPNVKVPKPQPEKTQQAAEARGER